MAADHYVMLSDKEKRRPKHAPEPKAKSAREKISNKEGKKASKDDRNKHDPGYLDVVPGQRGIIVSHYAGSQYMVMSDTEKLEAKKQPETKKPEQKQPAVNVPPKKHGTASHQISLPTVVKKVDKVPGSPKPEENPYMVLSAREKLEKVEPKKPVEQKAETPPKVGKVVVMEEKEKHPSVKKSDQSKKVHSHKTKHKSKTTRIVAMMLLNEKNEPELCPRIFAVVLIWVVMIMGIVGFGYFHAHWFDIFKESNKDKICYTMLQMRRHGT